MLGNYTRNADWKFGLDQLPSNTSIGIYFCWSLGKISSNSNSILRHLQSEEHLELW
jgi:hypothetical protein